MCGRYVRKGEVKTVDQALGLQDGQENWTESYNVAPGSTIPIVTADPAGRHMVLAAWGFTSPGRAPLFNARGETVDSLPCFRNSFRLNRCLVPASGFYEWRPSDRKPFYFELSDAQFLAFAGIWKRVGDHLQTTVITTVPNHDMEGVHDRMPVILSPDTWSNWLSATPLPDHPRRNLLSPSPDGSLSCCPVGRRVGSIRNNYPSLIHPIEEPPREITPDLFE